MTRKTYQTPLAVTLLNEPYPMTLVGNDAQAVVKAVNEGIDSYLTAICNSSFEWIDNGYKLKCRVAPGDLMVLLRRLLEDDDEDGQMLANAIIGTLFQDDNDEWLVDGTFINPDRPYLSPSDMSWSA